MKLSYKIWLDHHGKAFGDGPHELLKWVEKENSLRQAALRMGMAYSKAWRLIRTLEQRLDFPLLERRTGGLSGGGSRVTPMAKELMERYKRFREDVDKNMGRIFHDHFDSLATKLRK